MVLGLESDLLTLLINELKPELLAYIQHGSRITCSMDFSAHRSVAIQTSSFMCLGAVWIEIKLKAFCLLR